MKKLLVTLTLALSLIAGCVEYEPTHINPHTKQHLNPKNIPTEIIEEVFLNEAGLPADIVIYIDLSGSMLDDQIILWNQMDTITNRLNENNINYRIAGCGTGSRLVEQAGVFGSTTIDWVNPHTGGPGTALQDLVWASGNTMEAGLDAIGWGFSDNFEQNENFFRYQTPLHIVTISDEPDQSIWFTPNMVQFLLEEHSNNYNSYITYAAVRNPYQSSGYETLANLMNEQGTLVSIFDEDWTAAIDNLDYLATQHQYKYYLMDGYPQIDTLKVMVKDDGITFVFSEDEYVYNHYENSIEFPEYNPESDATIIVQYIPEH